MTNVILKFFALMAILPTLTGILLPKDASAFDIIIPNPERMIIEAPIIVLGRLNKSEGEVFCRVTTVIKGEGVPNLLPLHNGYPQELFNLETLIEAANGEECLLFLTTLPSQSGYFPKYALPSLWPQGNPEVSELRLDECIDLAKQALKDTVKRAGDHTDHLAIHRDAHNRAASSVDLGALSSENSASVAESATARDKSVSGINWIASILLLGLVIIAVVRYK